jgi:general nucleoside transport system ATP-binding protein
MLWQPQPFFKHMMRVELKDIYRYFGLVHANDGITLTVESGTIHGLLGENGAGKSTLMKILSGFITADRGEILLDGRPVHMGSPAAAIRQGVGMLYQDPLDFAALAVLDNFILGGSNALVPNRDHARRELLNLAAQFDFNLNPDALVSSLTIGERQQLEILRLLWLGVQVLILDEPTTAISAQQRDKLFAALRKLAEQGKAVLFVSHKLEEVQQLCDKVTVLTRGKVTGEADIPCDNALLVRLMFGQALPPGERARIELGASAVELDHVTLSDPRLTIADFSLNVCAGEVIGLAGLEGSGQWLLLRALAGLAHPTAGHIRLAERDLTGRSYHDLRGAGVAYITAGRLEEGLVAGLTLTEHIALAECKRALIVDWRAAMESAEQRIRDFNIRGRPYTEVQELSGGNQQRTLLALLPPQLKLLLMEHPTRGLDIESAEYVWKQLLERRKLGTAIIFASSDLDELLERSDRILVFFSGRVSKPLDARRTNVEQLGQLIGGMGL